VRDLTQILSAAAHGDSTAAEQLLPLLYDELRRMAQQKLQCEKPGQTLQATALVHEAWMKLAGPGRENWASRTHFFSAAAEAMRRILVDQARRKTSKKRGGGQTVEELHESRIEMPAPSEEVLAVGEALVLLEKHDAVAAEVVKLRYFAGLTVPEVAEFLRMSPRTVDRHWAFARAWLKQIIKSGEVSI
jgi:RNA polymerase sigma factor (TIGR02999 family)